MSRRGAAAVTAACLLGTAACTSSPAAVATGGEITNFTIGNPMPIASLDPTSPEGNFPVADLVTQPLATLRTDGTLVPEMASHVGVTANQLTFDLRSGARFSDGEPVTVDDVVASLKRATAAPTVAPNFGAVSGITAQGPSRVVVSLSRPDATVLPLLLATSQVMEKKQLDAAGTKFGSPSAAPVGAGPYKVASFTTAKLTLVRNDNYWGSKPNIKSLNVVYVADENTAQLAMRAGTINIYWDNTAQQIRAWAGVPGATATTLPAIRDVLVTLDTTHAPFDDIHVRRAIAHAIDRTGLSAAVFGGHAEVLKSVLATIQLASVSSHTAAENFLDGLPTYDYDITKAKAELAQSKSPNGFSVTLPIDSSDAVADSVAQSMEQTLKPLGISITIKKEPTAQWLQEVTSAADKGMELETYGNFVPAPSVMLPYLVGTAPAAQAGNFAQYKPPSLDQPISTLLTSSSAAEQFAAAKTVATAAANDVPYVPLFSADLLMVTSKGFTLSKTADASDIYSDRIAFDIQPTP